MRQHVRAREFKQKRPRVVLMEKATIVENIIPKCLFMCHITLSLTRPVLQKVAPQLLLSLNCLEQGLEIASTKSGKVVSLNDLDEDSWSVHEMLRPETLAVFVSQ